MIKENFIEILHEGFQKFWDKPMYTNYPDGNKYTFSQVAQEIKKAHLLFEAAGVKKGEKISVIGKNSAEWAITYLAVVTYGAVIVPILPDFKPEDVHHIVKHSDSVLLYADSNLWKALDAKEMPALRSAIMLNQGSIINISDKVTLSSLAISDKFSQKYPDGIAKEKLEFASVDNREISVLNYTSGTTGFSKGVMIPANSLAGNILFGAAHIPVDDCSNIVSFLPMAHTYGCAFDFLLSVIKGIHVHFIGKLPTPQVLLPAFKNVKPQIILTVPLILEKIYKKRILPKINKPIMKVLLAIPGINGIIYKKILTSFMETFGGNLNEMVIGGAPLNEEAENFFRKIKFPFTIGYGMTECGPLISYDGWATVQAGSAGKLLNTMEMKIESSDPFSVPGEICVRGENVMTGYYKNQEATNEVLDKDGWLHTGDMGITDKDKYIFIRGRSKSMLLGPSGQNIYPEEIEAKLNNLDYVAESLIIQDKDHKLIALVYPDKEQVKLDKLSDKKLAEIMANNRRALNRLVRAYESVSSIEIHPDEFVKTPKRSIKRYLYERK